MADELRGKTMLSEGYGTILDVKLTKGDGRGHVWISSPTIRDALRDFVTKEGRYVFMRTSANPEAAQLIIDSHEELSRARFGYIHNDFDFYFDDKLLERYVDALGHLAKQKGIEHISYPIVRHNRHPDSALLPYIHVVREIRGDATKFSAAVNSLNSDAAYEFIAGNEAPLNYNLGSVNLLRNRGVAPLRLEDRVWNVDAQTLRDAADFLLQFEYHRDEPHGFCEDD